MSYKYFFGLFLVAVPWVAIAGKDTALLCMGTLLQLIGLIVVLRNDCKNKD